MSDPQRLPELPGRPAPKRLGKTPLLIGLGAVVVLGIVPLGAVTYNIVKQRNQADVGPSDAGPASSGDVFAGAEGYTPAGDGAPVIDATARVPSPIREDRRATSTATNNRSQERQPDVHEQARLQAWQTYYQRLDDLKDKRRRDANDAMRADTAARHVQPQQGGQQAPDAGPQGGHPVPGQGLQLFQRPGQLYQGPVDAAGLYLAAAPVPPMSPYELKGGKTVIPFQTDQEIATGAAGQFTVTVSRNVMAYTSPDDILIPQGATLVGVYEDQTGAGDERMKTSLTKIVYPFTGNPHCPGGEELPLGSMPGADASGKAGFSDRVERHYGRIVGNAFINLIGGSATQAAGALGGSGAAALLAAQGGQAGQTALNQLATRQTGIGPSFETRFGYKGTLQLTKTIAFAAPWRPGFGFCGAGGTGGTP